MGCTRYFLGICLLILACCISPCQAQLFSVGYKQSKSAMFHVTFNYPLVFENDKPYEFMLGADYATRNRHIPSGLTPQATFMYYIDTR